jgi:hypothetical protein
VVQKEKAPAERSLSQANTTTALAELRERYQRLEESIQAMSARKTKLIVATRDPEFSRKSDVRAAVLNDIHNIDQFLGLHEEVGNALKSAVDTKRRSGAERQDEIARLTAEIDHLAFVAHSQDVADLGDAILTVSMVSRTGAAQDGVEKISLMYTGLATRRRLIPEVLGEIYEGQQDQVYLLVAGLGAYGLLKSEAGLHQVCRRYKQRAARSGREILRDDRELVRVSVSPGSAEPPVHLNREVKARISTLKPVRQRLLHAEFAVNIFHEPTLQSLDVWTSGPKEGAVSRCLLILGARSDGNTVPGRDPGIIRQYDLGLAPRVKDMRTGWVTTKVKDVLKGHFEIHLDH